MITFNGIRCYVISKINLSLFNDTAKIALEQGKEVHQNRCDGKLYKLYQINLLTAIGFINALTVKSREHTYIGHLVYDYKKLYSYIIYV